MVVSSGPIESESEVVLDKMQDRSEIVALHYPRIPECNARITKQRHAETYSRLRTPVLFLSGGTCPHKPPRRSHVTKITVFVPVREFPIAFNTTQHAGPPPHPGMITVGLAGLTQLTLANISF